MGFSIGTIAEGSLDVAAADVVAGAAAGAGTAAGSTAGTTAATSFWETEVGKFAVEAGKSAAGFAVSYAPAAICRRA